MNYITFRETFKNAVLISKSDILMHFPNFDNKNLTYWQKKWYIKKIIKNYYFFSDKNLQQEDLFFISNTIYFPAYISSYSALQYYNLIPEQVSVTLWVTTNSTKSYNTSLWIFKYHTIKKELFWWYSLKKIWNTHFYIADMEKCLLDFFYFHSSYKSKDDIKSLRLNYDILKEHLDREKLLRYCDIYNSKTLKKTILLLLDIVDHA